MHLKSVAIALLLCSFLLAGAIYGLKLREDTYIHLLTEENGDSCFVNGVCLYEDRNWWWYILGWSASAFLLGIALFLYFFDRSQHLILTHQEKVAASLTEAKKVSESDEKFKAFLSGFSDDEQKVLSAIHDQDGILQSTLRYRTGMSKSTLSIMLKQFEEKGLISRKESGKTNKVFLRKVY